MEITKPKPMYVGVEEVCADWGVSRSKGYAIIKQLSDQMKAENADLKIKNMNAYLISTLYTESMSGILAEEVELHDDYLKYLRGQPY